MDQCVGVRHVLPGGYTNMRVRNSHMVLHVHFVPFECWYFHFDVLKLDSHIVNSSPLTAHTWNVVFQMETHTYVTMFYGKIRLLVISYCGWVLWIGTVLSNDFGFHFLPLSNWILRRHTIILNTAVDGCEFCEEADIYCMSAICQIEACYL